VGLEVDPSRRLGDLKYPESPRTRKLSQDEIGWYLKGLAQEKSRTIRRGLLVLLLTAARISEVVLAGAEEVIDGTWTIPAERSKNHTAHTIKLGPWGQALMVTEGAWIFKADRSDGPRKTGWYEARTRIHERMIAYAGKRLDRFCPHDLRRTARSNTKRLKVDFETAEAMLNHLKTGMERIYDGYELEEEKAAWFLKWETEIAQIARDHGLARILEVADPIFSITSPVAVPSIIEWQGRSSATPSGMTITAGRMTPLLRSPA
jgi:integrase